MPAYHNILSKCDSAIVAYLLSRNVGTAEDTFPAKRSGTKTLACTIVWSQTAEPLEGVPYSGIKRVVTAVSIRTPALIDEPDDDQTATKASSDDRVSATFDSFWFGDGQSGEDLANAINAAASTIDVTFQSVTVSKEEAGFEREGSGWVDTIYLESVVCPKALAE